MRAMRAFSGGGRSGASPSSAGSEEGPQPGDLVVAGAPVTFHPPHPVGTVLAHEVGWPENVAPSLLQRTCLSPLALITHQRPSSLLWKEHVICPNNNVPKRSGSWESVSHHPHHCLTLLQYLFNILPP